MGTDIVLRDRSIDLAHSFRLMVPSPMDYLLATLRTLLAMVRGVVGGRGLLGAWCWLGGRVCRAEKMGNVFW